MSDTVDSIQFSGEPAALVDPESVDESDLMRTSELEPFLPDAVELPDRDGPAMLSTDQDGSYYVVADSDGAGGLELAGVVPAAAANEALGLAED